MCRSGGEGLFKEAGLDLTNLLGHTVADLDALLLRAVNLHFISALACAETNHGIMSLHTASIIERLRIICHGEHK
jgi:hypothetical protein